MNSPCSVSNLESNALIGKLTSGPLPTPSFAYSVVFFSSNLSAILLIFFLHPSQLNATHIASQSLYFNPHVPENLTCTE